MAHELVLNKRTGKYEMAFAGALPWHGLGQSVSEGAPLETWAREGGMQWRALTAPVEFRDAQGLTHKMGDKKVIYRSDTGEPLSVMGDGYNIVQPLEVLEFFRDLTERNEWHIHTVGVLNGGKRFWALARNHTEAEVVPGDRVKGNLLLATSLDGTLKTHAVLTTVRVVCANTIHAALWQRENDWTAKKGKASRVAVSHRSEFDADEVKGQIGVARESFDAFMEGARKLAETAVTPERARELLRELIGKPTLLKAKPAEPVKVGDGRDDFARLLAGGATVAPAFKEHRNVDRVMQLFEGAGRGADHIGSRGTAWGLLNAVTEFVDHEAARTSDNRLNSAWFGRGADLKDDTFKALLAM
jgi:phage/plasmid-like protein (TIGR03299 family)